MVLLSSANEAIVDRSTTTVKTFIQFWDLPPIIGPGSMWFFVRIRVGLPNQKHHAIPLMAVSSIEGGPRRVLWFPGRGGGAFFANKGLLDSKAHSYENTRRLLGEAPFIWCHGCAKLMRAGMSPGTRQT
jgi:hypothetical protein